MDGYLFFNKLISDHTLKFKAAGAREGGGQGGPAPLRTFWLLIFFIINDSKKKLKKHKKF